FRTLRAVLGAALLAVLDALGVENAADDVVAHTRKVLHAAATDHDDGVFLQVVTFARDVADDFEAIGQADLGDLTQSRVRLLRGRRVDAGANAALLGVFLQSRNLVALYRRLARLADQLVYGRHRTIPCNRVSLPLRADTWPHACSCAIKGHSAFADDLHRQRTPYQRHACSIHVLNVRRALFEA